eukprot:6179648-Pleurochrysis_carterae.AAC.2
MVPFAWPSYRGAFLRESRHFTLCVADWRDRLDAKELNLSCFAIQQSVESIPCCAQSQSSPTAKMKLTCLIPTQ